MKVSVWKNISFQDSLIQILFLDPANPTGIGILISGAAGFEEWIGMGLISLGIARVIALLEKK